MNNYLLDTNIIIDLFKKNQQAVSIIQRIQNDNLFITVITIAEFYQGVIYSTNKSKTIIAFKEFIWCFDIQIISVDEEVAQKYAELQGYFKKKVY